MFLCLRSCPLQSEAVWKVKQQKRLFRGDDGFFWKESYLLSEKHVTPTGHNQAFKSTLYLSKNTLILLKVRTTTPRPIFFSVSFN